jgi:hypothetical protein
LTIWRVGWVGFEPTNEKLFENKIKKKTT